MPALNFPTNRSELDPPQAAGPLQDGDAFTDAGITWTWNATLEVWSTDGTQSVYDARYLRVDAGAPDQTRASGLATFSSGVGVSGGTAADVENGMYYGANVLSLASHGDQIFRINSTDARSVRVVNNVPYNNANSTYVGLQVNTGPNPDDDFTNQDVFRVTECVRATPNFNNGNSVHGALCGFRFDGNQLVVGNIPTSTQFMPLMQAA